MIADVAWFHLDAPLQTIETEMMAAGIAGLGYVGLPLAQVLTSQGFKVLGLDIDAGVTPNLMAGDSYLGQSEADATLIRTDDDAFDYPIVSLSCTVIDTLNAAKKVRRYREHNVLG